MRKDGIVINLVLKSFSYLFLRPLCNNLSVKLIINLMILFSFRDILQSEDVLRFLRNSNELLFWGCNIESPEGYRVSRTLREHTYPFIGVIGLTNIPSKQ